MLLLDICIIAIIILLGYNVKMFFTDFNAKDKKIVTQLFFYHLLVTIFFHFYLMSSGGDAIQYWIVPSKGDFSDIIDLVMNRKANSFVYLFNYFPSAVLELSMFTGNMLYSFLGYLGFVYLYRLIKELIPTIYDDNKFKIVGIPIFPTILFLPNLHFWSCAVGKDVLLFFSVILFVYAMLKVNKRLPSLIFAIVIALAVRPHIVLFLFTAFGIGYIYDGRLKLYQKFFIVAIFIVGFVSIFDYVTQFIQLENLEISTFDNYTAKKLSDLNTNATESGIDTTNYPLPLKVFTFLYRPLFFDGNGLLAIIASIENTVLLIFTYLVVRNKPRLAWKSSSYLIKALLFYVIIGSIGFSLILGNLGIMLRQKNMFIPMLLVFGLWVVFKNPKIYYYNKT